LETAAYKYWSDSIQKEFWNSIAEYKIPVPSPYPRELGKDRKGREIGTYSPKEYWEYLRREEEIGVLRRKSWEFKRRRRQRKARAEEEVESEIEDERNRRKLLARLEARIMGKYEGDPVWDDVIPIAQDEGEGALAAIAYTDEYAEGILLLPTMCSLQVRLTVRLAISYLRAVMASEERTPRVLDLTSHIISLNPAHYTVWLYRASTIFALNASIQDELDWVNDIALSHQKNYQIWHHRQLLIENLYPAVSSSPSELAELEESEREFMTQMFDQDAKNYHVWSYRQYLVRKLNLFNPAELASIEELLKTDVRNNSAWSHRFFIVFSDPKYSTPESRATAHDPAIPNEIIDREISFAQAATYEAPQNQSPWNYLRGVLRKGGRQLSTLESFASEFVDLKGNGEEGGEVVRSSHALDFLADAWTEQGKVAEASKALGLLGDRYDRVRKNYWEWRRKQLDAGETEKVKDVEEVATRIERLEVKA